MTTELFGWIGSLLFSLCGLPQAVQCARDGHARGLSWSFLAMWFFGEVFTIIYVWPKADVPLLANYMVNLVFLVVMLRYKISERPASLEFHFTPRQL